MIRTCTCASVYQDARYGVGKRVMNMGVGTGGGKTWRCTVCGRLDAAAPAQVKAKTKDEAEPKKKR